MLAAVLQRSDAGRSSMLVMILVSSSRDPRGRYLAGMSFAHEKIQIVHSDQRIASTAGAAIKYASIQEQYK
jgi:hypothetical protein